MSGANQPYDVIKRLEAIEKLVKAPPPAVSIPGLQILPTGQPFFPGGVQMGGGSMVPTYEPSTIPPATGVTATWGSSFDTIFIDVTWTAPTGYGADQVTQYLVQAVKAGAVPIEVTTSGATTTRIQPVEPHTTYTIYVQAITKNGRGSVVASTTVTTGGDSTAPAAVTFPASPVQVGLESLAIKWNANTERDVINGAGQYRVVLSVNANLSSPVQDFKVGGTQAFVTGLTANTPYYVGLYAIDSSGNSSAVAQPPGGPWTPAAITSADVAIQVGGGNTIKNSSFEAAQLSAGGWAYASGGTYALDTTTFRYGTQALKISGTGDFYTRQDVTVGIGTWTISCWAKASSVQNAPGVTTSRGLSLNVTAQTGTISNPTILMGGTAGSVPTSLIIGAGTFEWKRAALKVTVTSGTATLRVQLQRGSGGAATGNAWFDGVQIEEGDAPSAYAPEPDEILPGTITATEIADNSITSPKIIAGAIVAGKIAAGTIGANEIAARSIDAGKIATGTLTANELAAGSVTASELAANSVTAAAIAANTVTAAKIAAGTITATQLATTLGITVGQQIQSVNYVPASTGWRIGGNGAAEFASATIRGSSWIEGSINIANKLFVSTSVPGIGLADNVAFGANYSGTIYAGNSDGNLDWGLQVASDGSTNSRATWVRYRSGFANWSTGFYNTAISNPSFYIEGLRSDAYFPTGDGRVFVKKKDQGLGTWFAADAQGWGDSALIVSNGGYTATQRDDDRVAIAFWAPVTSAASVIQTITSSSSDFHFMDFNCQNYVGLWGYQHTPSSQRWKSNVEALADAPTDVLMALRPVRYNRKAASGCSYCGGTGKVFVNNVHGPDHGTLLSVGDDCPHGCAADSTMVQPAVAKTHETPDLGLIAEEVEAVLPEVVRYMDHGDGPVASGLDYTGITALLVHHVQGIDTRLKKLEKANAHH